MKTYFIGLGGCGLKTVAEISKRLKNAPDSDFAEDFAFTYIDTDMYTVKSLNRDEIVISASDFVDMGPTVPLQIYKEALHSERPTDDTNHFLEWVISQVPGHMVLPNQPLTDGATAQRQVGRCGIYQYYNEVERELARKISRFQAQKTDDDGRRDVDIWVVASSCGGTGSSMILDVLYMINRIANPVANGEPKVKLVLYMPQAFVELNNDNPNHRLNGYSCMEEINFFRSNYEDNKKQTFDPFAVRPRKKGDPILDFPLFQFMIPVCSENNTGSRMDVGQLYPTVAEMIYYLNIGDGKNKMQSDLSNLIPQMKQNSSTGITNSMVGYGFRAIKKANDELKEYLTRRALYEIVNYGLEDKNRPGDFTQLQMDFANKAILSKLVQMPESITESGKKYKYAVNKYSEASLEKQVKKYVDNSVRYDKNAVTPDVLRTIVNRLEGLQYGDDFVEIKDAVSGQITEDIDKEVNDLVLGYGLQNTYDLLNTVDDFYLEPLYRHIISIMLPDADAMVVIAKAACGKYIKDGVRKRHMAAVGQCIDKYINSVANAVSLRIASEIINDLTKQSDGYLEKLRKGGKGEVGGIENLKKLIDADCITFKEDYEKLSKSFRATSNDAMTIYLPSLAEMATGENNGDWADDNFFDLLYQGSILEQQKTASSIGRTKVPMRDSQNSRGLKNILEKMDPNGDVFIKLIKEKTVNQPLLKDQSIINPLKGIVHSLANDPTTMAGEWMSQSLSQAVHNPALLPKAFKKTEDLFNSFTDTNRVPVFFPLKVHMPSTVRLMFVGENEAFAKELGYDKNNKGEHTFVQDSKMSDRFMVMKMPVGLAFEMYKYYPYYKEFYRTHLPQVRGMFYGCYIHKAFNEYGFNVPQMSDGETQGNKGISTQLVEKRAEMLVRCLFYQHVVNILHETDMMSYNKLFGFSTSQIQFDDSDLTPEMRELLGLDNVSSVPENTMPEQFISYGLDMQKHIIRLELRPVGLNVRTNNLEIGSEAPKVYEFDKNGFERCETFFDKLMKIPAELFNVVDYMDNRFDMEKDEQMHRVLEKVKGDAKSRLMRPNDPTIKFAFSLLFWKKCANQGDRELIDAMDAAINLL